MAERERERWDSNPGSQRGGSRSLIDMVIWAELSSTSDYNTQCREHEWSGWEARRGGQKTWVEELGRTRGRG